MPYARRRTSSSDVVPRSASFAGSVGAPRAPSRGGTSEVRPSPSLSRRRLHPDDRCAARTASGSGESSHPATATGAAASCASWTSSTTARLRRLPRALGTLRRSASTASTPTFRLRTTWTSGGKGRANLSRPSRRGTRTSSGMGSHSSSASRRVSRAGMASQTRPPPRARSFGAVPAQTLTEKLGTHPPMLGSAETVAVNQKKGNQETHSSFGAVDRRARLPRAVPIIRGCSTMSTLNAIGGAR